LIKILIDLSLLAFPALAASADERMNLVVIVADDLGQIETTLHSTGKISLSLLVLFHYRPLTRKARIIQDGNDKCVGDKTHGRITKNPRIRGSM